MDPIRSIVVPTDFSPLAEAAAARAVAIARLDGASVHLIHAARFPLIATPYEVSVPAAVWEGIRLSAQERLEDAKKTLEEHGIETVTAEMTNTNDAVHAIQTAVNEHAADFVVMGTHGHGGFKHAFLGSVAERTLRTLDIPVLAVKEELPRAAEAITRILVAVDFSIHSDRAVDVAVALGKRLGVPLDIVHAFNLPPDYNPYLSSFTTELDESIRTAASERLEEIRTGLAPSELPVTLHSRRGQPSVVISEIANEIGCQLIVMGTRGNSGLAHVLLGSVAERTLRAAPCSVLTVKAETR